MKLGTKISVCCIFVLFFSYLLTTAFPAGPEKGYDCGAWIPPEQYPCPPPDGLSCSGQYMLKYGYWACREVIGENVAKDCHMVWRDKCGYKMSCKADVNWLCIGLLGVGTAACGVICASCVAAPPQ